MNRNVLWCFLLCCLVVVSTALAQEDVLRPHSRAGEDGSSGSSHTKTSRTPIAIGIDAGMNYNIFSQNLTAVGQAFPSLKVLESASGFSPFVDAYVDIGIHRSVGIQVKIGYDVKKVSNEKSNTENCTIYQFDAFGNPIAVADTMATINNEYSVSPAFITIAALLRVNITENLVGTIGPALHLASGKPLHKFTRTIQTPDSCYFNFGTPQQSRTVHTEGEEPNTTSARLGVELGLGYKIPLARSVALVPKVGFQLLVSDAFDKALVEGVEVTSSSKLHSVQFSIGLLFGL